MTGTGLGTVIQYLLCGIWQDKQPLNLPRPVFNRGVTYCYLTMLLSGFKEMMSKEKCFVVWETLPNRLVTSL